MPTPFESRKRDNSKPRKLCLRLMRLTHNPAPNCWQLRLNMGDNDHKLQMAGQYPELHEHALTSRPIAIRRLDCPGRSGRTAPTATGRPPKTRANGYSVPSCVATSTVSEIVATMIRESRCCPYAVVPGELFINRNHCPIWNSYPRGPLWR